MLTPEQIAEGWITHDGGKCPVDLYTWVTALSRDGSEVSAPALFFLDKWSNAWEHEGPDRGEDVIAYRPEPSHD